MRPCRMCSRSRHDHCKSCRPIPIAVPRQMQYDPGPGVVVPDFCALSVCHRWAVPKPHEGNETYLELDWRPVPSGIA